MMIITNKSMIIITSLLSYSLLIRCYIWNKPVLIKRSIISMSKGREETTEYISSYVKKSLSRYEIKEVYLNNKQSDINLTNETIDLSFWCNNFNLTKDDIKESSIIEDIDSLTIPLINLDLKKMTGAISEKLMSPHRRFKAFFALIKGVGGGKSRALEEIRLYYQLYRGDCLAIPITFIGNSEYKKGEMQPLPHYKRLRYTQSIVLSVGIRMIYMFYKNITFSTASKIVYEMFDGLKNDEYSIEELLEYLLSELISHFKSSLELKGKQINSFVLLIDEATKACDNFDFEDAFSYIRIHIYSEAVNKHASSLLIMSSLKNTIYRDRLQVYPIELPESLDINSIVDMIWIPTIRRFPSYTVNKELPNEYRNRLLMLASIVNTAPRLVEMVKLLMIDYLSSHYNRSDSNDDNAMNTMLSSICNNIINMMKNVNTQYSDNYKKLCKVKYLRALIHKTGIDCETYDDRLLGSFYGKRIDCDDEVFDLIKYSAFVNQLRVYDYRILPITNIVYLHTALKSLDSKEEINKSLEELLDLFLEYISNSRSYSYSCDEFLEIISMKWIKIRLQSMTLLSQNEDSQDNRPNEDSQDNRSIMTLFNSCFSSSYSSLFRPLINPYDSNPLKKRLGYNYYGNYCYDNNEYNCDIIWSLGQLELSINKQVNEYSITSSVESISQWKNEIKGISDSSVAVMKSSYKDGSFKENYDFGLLAAFKDHSLLIFIDAKSFDKSISPNRSSISRKNRFKPFYYNYFDMCNIQNEITEEEVMGLKSTNYLRAMYEGNWLYIYQTTYNGPNIYLSRDDFEDDENSYHKKIPGMKYGSLLIINRDSTFNYLSFISEAYKVIRNQANKDKNDL